MKRERLFHLREHFRLHYHVSIAKNYQLALGLGGTAIACDIRTLICLFQIQKLKTKFIFIFFYNRTDVVARTIVDDDNFIIIKRLAGDAFQALGQLRCLIINRNDNTDHTNICYLSAIIL